MGFLDRPITRRGALGVGAGTVIGYLGLGATTQTAQAAGAATQAQTAHTVQTAQAQPAPNPADLTPAQLAGQRVIFSYPGTTPPSSLFDQISSGQAGGVIFFGQNVTSLDQIAGVIAQLEAAQEASPVSAPLLLMTDQEGGEVRRLPGEPVLSEKQIGESADPAAAAANAGTGAGQNLNGVGMNVNLAPVLDVYRQEGDFDDQYGRSYSSDPNVVSQCGSAFIAAQQQLGVAATTKHFPGLGAAATDQNTDEVPVTLNVPLGDLRSIDIPPFAAAISKGVQLVMASWAVYPALDPDLPSGLSPAIIGGELRQRLRYDGVTITDSLGAGAITSFGTPDQCGVLAAKAGMDLLLASSQDVSEGQATVNSLAGALQNQELDPRQFGASLRRVFALRQGLV